MYKDIFRVRPVTLKCLQIKYIFHGALACVASVSVRFRRKERGKRFKDREKSGASIFHFLALVSFLARSKPKVPFLGISLLRNQTETLATQANRALNFLTVSIEKMMAFRSMQLKWYNLFTNML